MGATTLYHPISLYVIRGAAIHNGFKLAKISQTYSGFVKGEAGYRCEIKELPKSLKHADITTIKHALQSCFMDDILVTAVYFGRKGYTAHLKVSLDPNPEQTAIPDSAFTIENTRA